MNKDYISTDKVLEIGYSQEFRNAIIKALSTNLTDLITHLRLYRIDGDRSEISRRFSIAITEAEKLRCLYYSIHIRANS